MIVATAVLCGCKDNSSPASSSATDTNRTVYQVKGVIKKIMDNGKSAEIAHEEIPDYMAAMTMDFTVKTPSDMSGLKPGDSVGFDMVVTSNDGWIERVRKIAPQNTNSHPANITINTTNEGPMKFRKSPIVEPLEIGDQVPDYKFTNHWGEAISFAQFRGRALGVTFVFTRCPFPTYCPRMNNNFAGAQQKLLAAGGPTNWALLSVSIDPEFDRPKTLAAYSKSYKPDSNHWQFVVGDYWNLDGLTEQVGLQFWKQDNSINHNLRTAVFDTRGRLQKIFVGNEWPVQDFATEMQKAAAVK
ncbi:MAG TPA: SCO family protein [Candidatus Acidoferrum sp.]|nr:SCO family protein [Candidatus Acidoferrum sp.]